jgi:hypothetical protein
VAIVDDTHDGGLVAKIKTIELAQLVAMKKVRRASQRQLALMNREAEYEKAINNLGPDMALAFESSEEKMPTLRAPPVRVIARNERRDALHFAVIGGVAYVALAPIPGVRKPRRSKTGQRRRVTAETPRPRAAKRWESGDAQWCAAIGVGDVGQRSRTGAILHAGVRRSDRWLADLGFGGIAFVGRGSRPALQVPQTSPRRGTAVPALAR